MTTVISYKSLRGLDLQSNPWTGVPGKDAAGGQRNALTQADNVVLNRDRMVANRRGFAYFSQTTPSPIDKLFEYQSQQVQHQQDNTLWHEDASAVRTQYTGTFTPPTGFQMDASVAGGSLFFTSNQGVMKLDSVTNTPILAGLPHPLDTRATLQASDSGFLGAFAMVGYHVTWLRTDANKIQVRSDVSTRLVVTNTLGAAISTISTSGTTATVTTAAAHGLTTGNTASITNPSVPAYAGNWTVTVTDTTHFTFTISGTPAASTGGYAARPANVQLTFTVPAGITTNDYFEVWRTISSPYQVTDPGDTCYLVSKVQNTTAALGTVTFTDTTSDTILNASTPLYTNANQEGITAANGQPPLSNCVAQYKDYLFFAGTSLLPTQTLNMLAVLNFVSGTSSITLTRQDGNGTRTYKCGASENVATQQWQLITSNSSNALNIEQTTRSLCHVISGDPSGYWYAEYTAGPADNPGVFRIFARSCTSGAFTVTADNATTGAQFSPKLPPAAGSSTVLATADARLNRIYWSKPQQPDAVPLVNYLDVGRLDQPIMRIISCRDALYVLKTDGIWFVAGLSAPFSVTQLDMTCHIIAPATAVMLNNMVWCLSNQGVVKISLSGVTVISWDIEPSIMVQTIRRPNIATVAFAVAHEADRTYFLWLPQADTDTVATHCFAYHTFVEGWTRWDKQARTGLVMGTDFKLYLSSGLEPALLVQRKNGDVTDYSDEEIATSVVSFSPPQLTLNWTNTVFTPVIGMTVHQAGSLAKVLTVTKGTGSQYVVTIDRQTTFNVAACTVRMPIQSHVRLSPNNCGEIGMVKAFYTLSFLVDQDTVTQAVLEIATNEAAALSTYQLTRPIVTGWGLSPWGASLWGDVTSPAHTVPWSIDAPAPDHTGEALIGGWIHGVSQEPYLLAQVAVEYEPLGAFETIR